VQSKLFVVFFFFFQIFFLLGRFPVCSLGSKLPSYFYQKLSGEKNINSYFTFLHSFNDKVFAWLVCTWLTFHLLNAKSEFSVAFFECRKVGFASTTLHDWLKNLVRLPHPIKNKRKTNRVSRFPALCVRFM